MMTQTFPNPMHAVIDGVPLTLVTEPGLFSPQGIDDGTAALLAQVQIDNDPVAVSCAKRNAQLNGVESVHTAKHFIEKGFNRLVVGEAIKKSADSSAHSRKATS